MRSNMKRWISTLLVLVPTCGPLVWASSAQAQSNMAQMITRRFQAADTDHDGRLTRTEAEAGMPRVAKHFDQIDTAHTGSITLQQTIDFASKQRGG